MLNKKGNNTPLMVFIVSFWLLLAILSNMFHEQLLTSEFSNLNNNDFPTQKEEKGFKKLLSGAFNTLDDIPVIKYFVPIMQMMTIGYIDGLPIFITLILDAIGFFTIWIVISLARGTD